METIKGTTKRGQYFINAHAQSRATELSDVYKSFSSAKAKAYNDCRTWCEDENGYDFRIIAASRFVFSVAWQTKEGLRVETASNSYLVV